MNLWLLWAGSPFNTAPADPFADEPIQASSDNSSSKPLATSPSTKPGGLALEREGNIIAEHQLLVSPQVSGRVTELRFDAGQRVEKDELLAVLDSTEYQSETDRIQASLDLNRVQLEELNRGNRLEEIEQARAELAEAHSNLEQAQRNLRRKEELQSKGVLTDAELEDARNQFEVASKRVVRLNASAKMVVDGPRQERIRMAEAQVRQTQAELNRAKWRLDNCQIRAPISGIILKKNAELGNLVNPIAFNGSFSLCEMADLAKLEVELSVDERDISKVFAGQRCEITTIAFPDRLYQGEVSRLLPIADRAKSAIPVRVRVEVPVDEAGVYLKPDMRATVRFYAREAASTTKPTDPATDLEPADALSAIPVE